MKSKFNKKGAVEIIIIVSVLVGVLGYSLATNRISLARIGLGRSAYTDDVVVDPVCGENLNKDPACFGNLCMECDVNGWQLLAPNKCCSGPTEVCRLGNCYDICADFEEGICDWDGCEICEGVVG